MEVILSRKIMTLEDELVGKGENDEIGDGFIFGEDDDEWNVAIKAILDSENEED